MAAPPFTDPRVASRAGVPSGFWKFPRPGSWLRRERLDAPVMIDRPDATANLNSRDGNDETGKMAGWSGPVRPPCNRVLRLDRYSRQNRSRRQSRRRPIDGSAGLHSGLGSAGLSGRNPRLGGDRERVPGILPGSGPLAFQAGIPRLGGDRERVPGILAGLGSAGLRPESPGWVVTAKGSQGFSLGSVPPAFQAGIRPCGMVRPCPRSSAQRAGGVQPRVKPWGRHETMKHRSA